MIDVSVLYGGLETPSTPHRYARKITQIDPPPYQHGRRQDSQRSPPDRRLDLTRLQPEVRCCYTSSPEAKHYPDELPTDTCKAVLDILRNSRCRRPLLRR